MEELSRTRSENLREIKEQLSKLGYSSRLFSAVEFYLKYPQPEFQLLQRERLANEKICFRLFYEQTNSNKNFKLQKCEATLRIAPAIPDIKLDGISSKKLDKQMQSVDWSIDHHSEGLINEKKVYMNLRRLITSLKVLISCTLTAKRVKMRQKNLCINIGLASRGSPILYHLKI